MGNGLIETKNDPKTRTIHVRCTFIIPVEVPDDPSYDAVFDIEENHCPGTGRVGAGAAIERYIDECGEQGICWACALGEENKIVEVKSSR
ncbi:MAG TPA: hypothetical protein VL866_24255 [Pyrinomonadaceae bacterium]|nr:hypothetical protein [Pyrinomonadaceae bacterium]